MLRESGRKGGKSVRTPHPEHQQKTPPGPPDPRAPPGTPTLLWGWDPRAGRFRKNRTCPFFAAWGQRGRSGHAATEANGGGSHVSAAEQLQPMLRHLPTAVWAQLHGDPGLGWLRWRREGMRVQPKGQLGFPPPPTPQSSLAKQEGGLMGANSSGD